MEKLVEASGFTQKEYWEEYKPQYETSLLLIRENVSRYCAENNMEPVDLSEIEFSVQDEKYFEQLN